VLCVTLPALLTGGTSGIAMAYILLRRTIIRNPTGSSAFTETCDFFDTVARKPYSTKTGTQQNNPFELTKGDEVYRYEYRPGKTRLVLYDGNGSVYTQNITLPSTGVGTALALKLIPASVGATDQDASDACFDLTGQFGVAPYQLEVTGQGGNATGYYQTATSQLEIYPVRFYNLKTGQYFLKVTDATGDFRTQLVDIGVTFYGYPRGTALADSLDGRLYRKWWLANELRTELRNYSSSQGTTSFTLPYGTLVDAYLLPGSNGTVWRQVYADGGIGAFGAGVYLVDTSTASTSTLELENLILFNPDTTAEQNGGAIVEVQAGIGPLQFTLSGGAVPIINTTGRFDRLPKGDYQVLVTDALGTKLTVLFTLTDRYRFWKYESYFDLDGTPHRVELWRRDFSGLPSRVQGAGQPVIHKSDGLQSALGGQGDLPSAVNTSVELNFLAEIDLFEEVVLGDDRNCRCDYYYNGKLYFRGYVKPNIYTAPLLDGLQPVSIIATDGLADLKTTDMLGHRGQRLSGHRPVLHTLLHCLSRCQISLPVQIYTNRRDSAMATLDAPEEVATTNRTGYYDEEKGEPADQRTVVDALAQLLGGTLVQREGMWQIRSALEASLNAPGRAYLPAGTPLGDVTAVAPTNTILSPGKNRWHWLDSAQTKQVRPGWKSLKGEADAGWLKNALPAGNVFSDVNAWLSDFSQLQSVNGWHPPVGVSFPLVLLRVGEKGKDHSTLWPRSFGLSVRDDRYLTSPALPLASGLEAVPAFLTFTGKLAPTEYYVDYDNKPLPSPTTAAVATLPYEVVIDGHSSGVKLAEFKLVPSTSGADQTVEIPLEALPSGAQTAVLRVYSWQAPATNLFTSASAYSPFVDYKKGDVARDDYNQGKNLFVARRDQAASPGGKPPAQLQPPEEWARIEPVDAATGQLLVTSVGVQLRPQNATWDGEDNFRADGPGGTVRPTEPLKSYHTDVPLSAGLFSGNLFAFGRGVGLLDGTQTTSWARSIDKAASPLFEANVLDSLALRANNAWLIPGTIRHDHCAPPLLLDSVDSPNDAPSKRFLVGASTWDTQAARCEVSLLEIGASGALDLPDGARLTHEAYQYAPGKYAFRVRGVHGGGRRRIH
jgi:hypothetical protein